MAEPSQESRAAFITALNARLPRTRVIAQGLIRNRAGEVLLCELTYKQEWDLPGGVVDRGEPPAATVARELHEELGLRLPVGDLLTVGWLPPYRQWDDALLLVFEVAADPAEIERARLQPSEVVALHWCDPAAVAAHAAPYVQRHLSHLISPPHVDGGPDAGAAPVTARYLEDGRGRA